MVGMGSGGGMASSGMGGMMGGMGDSRGSMGGMGETMGGMSGSGMMGGGGMGGSMGMGNSPMNKRNSMGGGNRDTCCIIVRNLPFSYTWQNLKEKFQDCGDVRFTEIKMENGKSRGWGTVRFMSPDDARRAVNLMNGARIEGRMIDVKLDK